ncbi:MAG: phosphomannomutase/phosphoglucomutase [Planctomycetes bacterium]|nr:phosphomannomutase/phosphoglucomutase [Planctomycetota bacterium]
MSVFKAYDIRGIYPGEIDEKLAWKIGAGLVKLLAAKKLVVGRDMRKSAPSIQAAVIDGITAHGCDVIDIGLVSTPMAYFGIGSLASDGGLTTTASHNPPQYIGAKICRAGAVPMSKDTGIGELEKMAKGELPPPPGAKRGVVTTVDLRAAYQRHLRRFMQPWPGIKAVIDTANGMGGLEVPLVLEGSGLDWSGLFLEVDGTFPNHEANPLKDENIVDVRREVVAQKAHVGFAYDGDADRCCVIDEKGERIGADLITALLAREFLRVEKGAAIVYDLRASRVVAEEVAALGGRPLRERVGHSFIKATMRKENSPFAGELSGHFYFRDHYFSDCGTLAMVMVLNVMAREKRPLSQIVAPLRKYPSTGEVNFEVHDANAKLDELRATYVGGKSGAGQPLSHDELDGLSVEFQDFWFNVRKSNTEPLLRLMLEARTPALLAEKRAEIVKRIGGKPH